MEEKDKKVIDLREKVVVKTGHLKVGGLDYRIWTEVYPTNDDFVDEKPSIPFIDPRTSGYDEYKEKWEKEYKDRIKKLKEKYYMKPKKSRWYHRHFGDLRLKVEMWKHKRWLEKQEKLKKKHYKKRK